MRKGIYVLYMFRMLLEDFLVIILFLGLLPVSCLHIISFLFFFLKKLDILCSFVADSKVLSREAGGGGRLGASKGMTSFLKCIFYAELFKVEHVLNYSFGVS